MGLTQAQLQFSHKQLEHSLATLRHLHQMEPKHEYVLKMLCHLYEELNDWRGLQEILPDLKKRKVLSSQEYDALEAKVYGQIIKQLQQAGDKEALQQYWHDIPKHLRKEKPVVLAYVQALHQFNLDGQAEPILVDAIKHSWDNEYINCYGVLKTDEPDKQLERAEHWLKQYGSNAALYLCLGRLCLRNQLWGKARTYLQQCLDLENNADACAELAKLLEYLGEKDAALTYYRQGLMQVVSETELLSL